MARVRGSVTPPVLVSRQATVAADRLHLSGRAKVFAPTRPRYSFQLIPATSWRLRLAPSNGGYGKPTEGGRGARPGLPRQDRLLAESPPDAGDQLVGRLLGAE